MLHAQLNLKRVEGSLLFRLWKR